MDFYIKEEKNKHYDTFKVYGVSKNEELGEVYYLTKRGLIIATNNTEVSKEETALFVGACVDLSLNQKREMTDIKTLQAWLHKTTGVLFEPVLTYRRLGTCAVVDNLYENEVFMHISRRTRRTIYDQICDVIITSRGTSKQLKLCSIAYPTTNFNKPFTWSDISASIQRGLECEDYWKSIENLLGVSARKKAKKHFEINMTHLLTLEKVAEQLGKQLQPN